MNADGSGSNLRKLIREDFATHGSRLRSPGFQSLIVYRFGNWRNTLAPGIARKLLHLPYEALRRSVRNRHRIEIHHMAVIGHRVSVSDHGAIVVGNESTIGDDCVIAADVTMAKTKVGAPGRPTIGQRVVIGPGAAFVGGVRVGDDAIIGPNVVVFADVPARAVLMAPQARMEPRAEPDEAVRTQQVSAGLVPFRSQDVPSRIRVGDGVLAARSVLPRFEGPVDVGDGCVLHERVTVGWDPPYDSRPEGKPTRLGQRVELSAGSVVLRGVSVGDDAWIGPNVVVDHDVPAQASMTCEPARIFGGLRSSRQPE